MLFGLNQNPLLLLMSSLIIVCSVQSPSALALLTVWISWFFVVGDCPTHGRMISSILDLCPPDTSFTSSVGQPIMSPGIVRCSLRTKSPLAEKCRLVGFKLSWIGRIAKKKRGECLSLDTYICFLFFGMLSSFLLNLNISVLISEVSAWR